MLVLTRRVRFCVNAEDAAGDPGPPAPGYSGRPAMQGLGTFYELAVDCVGEVGATTGYLVDIQEIDRAVRATLVPALTGSARERTTRDTAEVLRACFPALNQVLRGRVSGVRLSLSPYHSVEVHVDQRHATIRQKFDFAAAHRLHVAALSDEENRRLFGKCNNKSGHGHNYQFEPVVEVPVGTGSPAFTHRDLARVCERTIIERFDHRHLNEDTEEFGAASGLNPSVENIARVFFELLDGALAGSKARLRSLTVWETDRTSATYSR